MKLWSPWKTTVVGQAGTDHLKHLTMKDFKRGYAHAIANVIHLIHRIYANDCTPPRDVIALPPEVISAWKGKGWSWSELLNAGVDEQDLVVLETYRKQLGLGDRPKTPEGDQVD